MTKPALTAEEWADNSSFGGAGKYSFIADELNETREPNWHGIAAVSLHGRTFGFTREMVDALRVIVRNWDGLDMGDERIEAEYVGDELRPLADAAIDNIEALLPPEKV